MFALCPSFGPFGPFGPFCPAAQCSLCPCPDPFSRVAQPCAS